MFAILVTYCLTIPRCGILSNRNFMRVTKEISKVSGTTHDWPCVLESAMRQTTISQVVHAALMYNRLEAIPTEAGW